MSVLALEGMEFYAYHGYHHKEQKIGGNYVVDVYIDMDFTKAATTDSMEGTIDYEQVYAVCNKVMQEPVKLIEHLAYRILKALCAEASSVEELTVRVTKIAPPIEGKVAHSFVEVQKSEFE